MKNIILTGILTLATLTGANAQIKARENAQQDRIGAGVKDGSITAAEAARLEREQRNLNRTIAKEKAANGGTLTEQQKYDIGNRQTQIKGDIYNARHNDSTANPNSKMSQRVGNGIQDGSLRPAEAAKIEAQRAGIQRQAANEKAANGGTLTPAEKRQIAREKTKVSREIHNKRNN